MAQPLGETAPDVWLLGSSDDSAALAAHFGLPFCFAHFINPDGGDGVTRAYRAHFKPSALHAQPVPMMAISVLCAETDEEADLLSKSREVWAMRLRTTGNPGPVPSVEEALEAAKAPERRALAAGAAPPLRRRLAQDGARRPREARRRLPGRRDHGGDDLLRLRQAQTVVRAAGRGIRDRQFSETSSSRAG